MSGGLKPRAVVGDRDPEGAVFQGGVQPDASPLGLPADPVLDGVFDQGLDREGRDFHPEGFRADIDPGRQAVPQPQALHLQVGLHGSEFLFQRHLLAIPLQQVAKDLGQVDHGAPCLGGRSRDEAVERIEGVEEEVGIDLRPQGLQLRPGGQTLQLGAPPASHLRRHLGGQAVQILQVLAEVASPRLPPAQEQYLAVSLGKPQGHRHFGPSPGAEFRTLATVQNLRADSLPENRPRCVALLQQLRAAGLGEGGHFPARLLQKHLFAPGAGQRLELLQRGPQVPPAKDPALHPSLKVAAQRGKSEQGQAHPGDGHRQ